MSRPISVVVPLLNEEDSLRELHGQLRGVADEHGYDLQLLLVDDGSTDGSWGVIQQLAERDPGVEGVRLRRNFGKAAGLMAGFDAAQAPIVVTMDADLQDDPAEIPKLLAALDGPVDGEGSRPYDVASGWKRERKDPWHKRWPSKVFNGMVSRLTKVKLHDHNCGLKAYRREVLDEIELYGELHRFVPVLAAARGYRTVEVAVNHRPRVHGASHYGASRLVKGLLDVVTVKFLTGYGDRPQHVLGGFGLLAFAVGFVGLAYLAAKWAVTRVVPGLEPIHLHQTASLFYSLTLCMVGSQFTAVALLGAMITSLLSRERSAYSVAEVTSHEAHPTKGSSEPTPEATPGDTSPGDSASIRREAS